MGLALTTTFALALWIVLWAIGAKGFDAFMISIVIILVGVTVRMLSPYIPGRRTR